VILNRTNLVNLGISFNARYQGGLTQAVSQFERVATVVPSTTKSEEYGWLGKIPNVREWVGDRMVQNLSISSYQIKNKSFELTISVDRDDIADDNLGIYGPLFEEMGRSTMAHKDQLVFATALAGGFATNGFDGVPFFSNAHPVLDANGQTATYANTDANPGNGPGWYLIDASRSLKPIIFQERKPFEFVAKNRPDDDNVFDRREFVFGVDGRHNVGYAFPQFAWGSKAALTGDNYGAARQAMMGVKSDYGRPIGVMPNLLVVPPALEHAGLTILNAERDQYGATNVYKGTAELLVVPWLA